MQSVTLMFRLLVNNRRIWIPCILFVFFCGLTAVIHQSDDFQRKNQPISRNSSISSAFPFSVNYRLTYNQVQLLLDRLLDQSEPLINIQSAWNELMEVWYEILIKFVNDACEMCHQNDSYCLNSIDVPRYVHFINQSFFPLNETKRPKGMGLYYYFDLKYSHSINNSILPTDVSSCDYFHMLQLMINVQLILHQTKIPYFLTKGTLIGVLRHHDVIPWDTDIDLFIPSSATATILKSFKQLDVKAQVSSIAKTTPVTSRKSKSEISFLDDLVVYRFRNIYKVTSYKIFSMRSPLVNRTNYRWPKIDIFPYEENATHIFAYPKHQHNLGTMNYIAKSNIEPVYLRILGPLLVPSPRQPRLSLKAMVRLGRSSVFYVCEGNTFLHRYNRGPVENWRVPCIELHRTYPFVHNQRNETDQSCFEQLRFPQVNQSLSLYKYLCDENLPRTL